MISEKKAKTPIGTVYPKADLNIRTGAGVSYAIAEKTAQKINRPEDWIIPFLWAVFDFDFLTGIE